MANVESCAPASYKRKRATGLEFPSFFKDVNAIFMWYGPKRELDKKKLHLYKSRFFEKGGWIGTEVTNETTHIFANTMAAILDCHWDCQRCPFCIQSQIKVCSYEWLTACLCTGDRVPKHFFRIDRESKPGCQLKNFKRSCGVVDASGTWKYVKGMGVEVKIESPEANVEEKSKLEGVVPEAEIPKKHGDGFVFDIPPWMTACKNM